MRWKLSITAYASIKIPPFFIKEEQGGGVVCSTQSFLLLHVKGTTFLLLFYETMKSCHSSIIVTFLFFLDACLSI